MNGTDIVLLGSIAVIVLFVWITLMRAGARGGG